MLVLPNPAKTPFPIIDCAVMPAQKAMNLLIVQLFVKEGFFHVISLVKTLVQSVSIPIYKHDFDNVIHRLNREEFYLPLHV